MSARMTAASLLFALLVVSFPAGRAAGMDQVAVSKDGRGFVLQPSGKPFVPWGLNYGNHGRLIEDYWESDWQAVEKDFTDVKALGGREERTLQACAEMVGGPAAHNSAVDRQGRPVHSVRPSQNPRNETAAHQPDAAVTPQVQAAPPDRGVECERDDDHP